MSEGGREAVRADDDVVPAAELRRLEECRGDLERLLSRKTIEIAVALNLAPCFAPVESPRATAWPKPSSGSAQSRCRSCSVDI